MTNIICNECETVAHCVKNGCAPKQPAYRAVKTYHEGKPVYVAEQPAPVAKPHEQEPVAWTPIDQSYPPGGELDILMGDGSILCEVLPQADGDLWWGGASTGERFIDPKYASVTHWRIHAEHTSPPIEATPLAQRQARSADTWVGLTDEERQEIWKGCDPTHAGYVTALVEAKLKEKNT